MAIRKVLGARIKREDEDGWFHITSPDEPGLFLCGPVESAPDRTEIAEVIKFIRAADAAETTTPPASGKGRDGEG